MSWHHLILDLYECRRDVLEDKKLLLEIFRELPRMMGMKVIEGPIIVHYVGDKGNPSGRGLSGLIIIAESHISIHTEVYTRYVSIDVYSCKDFDAMEVEEYLTRLFDAKKVEKRMLIRGPGIGEIKVLKIPR